MAAKRDYYEILSVSKSAAAKSGDGITWANRHQAID